MSDILWPHNCSTPGFPVLCYLQEFSQTHAHWFSDATQPTISSCVVSFSSCPQSFPASGPFPMSQLFASGGQSSGSSTSSSVLPKNIQGWFPLGWLVWSPCCSKDFQESSLAPQFQSINSLALSLLYGSTLHLYMTTGKNIALTIQTFVSKGMSLLFNTLSRFVIAFLPRSKCLYISWPQSPFAVILEPKKIKSVTFLTQFKSVPWWNGEGFQGILTW